MAQPCLAVRLQPRIPLGAARADKPSAHVLVGIDEHALVGIARRGERAVATGRRSATLLSERAKPREAHVQAARLIQIEYQGEAQHTAQAPDDPQPQADSRTAA